MANRWYDGESVTFVSELGHKSTRTISVTGEGFAVIKIRDFELHFTATGLPINDTLNPLTNGPRIIREQKASSDSLDNIFSKEFSIKDLTILQLQEILSILIKYKLGNKKVDSNLLKNSATTVTDSIKKVFQRAKSSGPKGNRNQPSKRKRIYRRK